MAYTQSCPACGRQLQPVALDPQTAPWLCNTCCLGFWVAELEQSHMWHHTLRSFGHAGHAARRAAVEAEAAAAIARGSSAREDQLMLLSLSQLQAIQKKASGTFLALVTAAIKAKGA